MQIFYERLTKDFNSLINLYSSNAEAKYGKNIFTGVEIKNIYEKNSLNKAELDFSKGNVSCFPVFASGIVVSVTGSIRRELEGKETVADLTQRFLLMPYKSGNLDVTYLIVNDAIEIKNSKIIVPKKPIRPIEKKKLEKPKTAVAPVKARKPEPVASKEEFSYARAAAAAPQVQAAVPPQQLSKVTKAQTTQERKPSGSQTNHNFKIRAKRVPANATPEVLNKAFSKTFGPVLTVKKVSSSIAVIQFKNASTVESILAKDPKDRSLKLMFEGEEASLTLWEERASGARGRGKPYFNNKQ